MKRVSSVLLVVLVFLILGGGSLFAGGARENPTKHNVSSYLGASVDEEGGGQFHFGYEAALGDSFAIGTAIGTTVSWNTYFDIMLKPRFYIGNKALEGFFLGGNVGLSVWESSWSEYTYYGYTSGAEENMDLILGANLGYKFVFGGGSSGFSLEPSIGFDILPYERFNIGVSLGYAFGGSGGQRPARQAAPASVGDGIYIGIVTLGPNAEDITNGPILLDRNGFNTLNRLLDTRYRVDPNAPGTALFYAAHLALANMKSAERRLPRRLDNVYILTFTDGLDNLSTGLSLANINDPGNTRREEFAGKPIANYMRFVKQELDTRRINNSPIEAYVAGVVGTDVTNIQTFRDALKNLAANPNPKLSSNGVYDDTKLQNFSDLRSLFFVPIARDLVDRWTVQEFRMLVSQFPPGTRVRMTFNNERTSQEAANARRYMEGEIDIRNRQYYLTNIRYHNVSSTAGTEIRGDILSQRNLVRFQFPGFEGVELQREQSAIRQFFMDEGTTAWQYNSEYTSGESSDSRVAKNNALIYLVLDQSNSIRPDQVDEIRESVKEFIRVLYNAYN